MSKEVLYLVKYGPSIALIIVTIYYAITTHMLLINARKEKAAKIFFVLTLDHRMVYITIKNTGKSAAKNLSVTLASNDVCIKPFRVKSVFDVPFLREPISYLPPGDGYQYRIGHLDVDAVRKIHPKLCFKFEYYDGIKRIKESTEFNLFDYLEVIQRSFKDPNEMIVGALRGIQTELRDRSFSKGELISFEGKECPFCCEQIASDAKKCKYCLEWQPEDKDEVEAE